MVNKGLNNFFESYLNKEPLFVDKKVLQSSYTPSTIPHREDQIKQIASILAPALKSEKPSNLFLYGKTGTGKTLTVKYVMEQMTEIARKKEIGFGIYYINCKLKRVADTEYRLIAQIGREFGLEIPATGLPTDEVYRLFMNYIKKSKKLIILILDEIDQLVEKAGDEILYNLTRLSTELKDSDISLIGISNDLKFTDNLDPRVRSSLSEEEIVFPPYNAIQLQDILRQRSKSAFRDGVISDGVIEKCAAYAAREHGDARRALELLRVAGELAERNNENVIKIKHIDEAEDKIDRDRILDTIKTQPKQIQATLLSILSFALSNKLPIFTGDVYNYYKEVCDKCGLKPLTQRRLSDIVAELDMLGIINAKVISKGRYGRTREITLAIPSSNIPIINQTLKSGLGV
ncbi:MAG TPA: ORC1-type DNA replication protein [Candidatus Nanoarchaeia archaeon]|nr:ORC1-type DNA replication protein [Candidatus Nanoarchaeia archaeon]